MQLNFSPKWFDKMVIHEKEHEIAAGVSHVKSEKGDLSDFVKIITEKEAK